MTRATLGFVLIFAAATAQAQATPPAVPLDGIYSQPEPSDAEPVQYLRTLDDSDPEMQQRTEAFYEMTPCGAEPHGVCPEALQLLIDGGDRLAHYLIRQIEQNEAEGFPNRSTYLRLLGRTESDVAFAYLAALLDARRAALARGEIPPHELKTTIEALGATRRLAVIDRLRPILEAEADPGLQVAAVNALDRVQVRHGPLPAVETALATLDERNAVRRTEMHAERSAQQSMSFDPTEGRDPYENVQQRVDMIRINPGHMRP